MGSEDGDYTLIYDADLAVAASMKALAKALITATAFLELADDDAVDSYAAIRVMESIACELQQCSIAEREALRVALRELAQQEEHAASNAAQTRSLEFYSEFMEYFGLEEDVP